MNEPLPTHCNKCGNSGILRCHNARNPDAATFDYCDCNYGKKHRDAPTAAAAADILAAAKAAKIPVIVTKYAPDLQAAVDARIAAHGPEVAPKEFRFGQIWQRRDGGKARMYQKLGFACTPWVWIAAIDGMLTTVTADGKVLEGQDSPHDLVHLLVDGDGKGIIPSKAACDRIVELEAQVEMLKRERLIDSEHHLRRERTSQEGVAAACAERDKWKANHDNMVKINTILRDRPDLGDRAKSMQELQARVAELEAVVAGPAERGPEFVGGGTWAVHAERMQEERDEAQARIAAMTSDEGIGSFINKLRYFKDSQGFTLVTYASVRDALRDAAEAPK